MNYWLPGQVVVVFLLQLTLGLCLHWLCQISLQIALLPPDDVSLMWLLPMALLFLVHKLLSDEDG